MASYYMDSRTQYLNVESQQVADRENKIPGHDRQTAGTKSTRHSQGTNMPFARVSQDILGLLEVESKEKKGIAHLDIPIHAGQHADRDLGVTSVRQGLQLLEGTPLRR